MRLLHTSDWHLGQTLHNYERTYEHQCFLDWLLDTLEREAIDVLLVAGDIFDNANPPASAQRQLYRFLQQAGQRVPGLQVIVIGGNHDSPARLEAPSPLLELHGCTVIGAVRAADGTLDLERLVVPLRDRTGTERGWCLAVPFVRPGDLPRPAQLEPGQDPYAAAVADLYGELFALAQARRAPNQAIVCMGHCHMVASQASPDSERRIVIGGSEALPASVFHEDVAYAALGHLHLAQRVGQREQVRYSGSPLPLSFSETGYRHQVLRIELADGAVRDIAPLPVPRAVDLLRVPPTPAPVEEALEALAGLDLDAADPQTYPYLEVRVLLDGPEPGLRARVEAALKDKPVRLARIEPTRKAGEADEPALSLDQLAALQPDDIFKRLYRDRYGADAPDDLLAAFAELSLPGEQA